MDDITNIGPDIPNNAVSLYGQDSATEDFPVLKAFQQYIDAEQAKARKRMLLLCVFFGVLMTIVITVFVFLLFSVSSHNQALNDKLFEFALKDRAAPSGSAVVVQPPADNSAILKLTEKLNEMQKRLAESQQAVAAAEAKADKASKPKEPTAEEREIERLKALLAAEKEQTALERERKHQAEIEAYRRKHYPELYERPVRKVEKASRRLRVPEIEGDDDDLDALLNDTDGAISYYDEEDEMEKPSQKARKRPTALSSASAEKSQQKQQETPVEVEPAKDPSPSLVPAEKNYSIPVDIKGSSSSWNIPLD